MRLEIDAVIGIEPDSLGFEKLALEVRRIPDDAPSADATLRVHDPVPGNRGSRFGHGMQRPANENRAQAAVEQPVACPRQVVIGDPTQGGFKAAMLPATITNLTCWDMTGIFAATK